MIVADAALRHMIADTVLSPVHLSIFCVLEWLLAFANCLKLSERAIFSYPFKQTKNTNLQFYVKNTDLLWTCRLQWSQSQIAVEFNHVTATEFGTKITRVTKRRNLCTQFLRFGKKH